MGSDFALAVGTMIITGLLAAAVLVFGIGFLLGALIF